jgi:2-hydroxycyclohexanecarboxyl-CoA dehydrogenase
MTRDKAGRLAGKVVLITGGAGGIGAAVARLFCAEGAKLALIDCDADALSRKAKSLLEEFPAAQLAVCEADIAQYDQAVAAVTETTTKLGGLDVLINNAAVRHRASLQNLTAADWQRVWSINLLGAVNFSRAAADPLRKSGAGAIVNVSSAYAFVGREDMGPYDTTKAALLALTRTLAFEEARHGVRVNAVCPGSTLTDFHLARGRKLGKSEADMGGEIKNDSLMKRWARPEEIAYPILWLASDEASFVTGSALTVDGGLSIM